MSRRKNKFSNELQQQYPMFKKVKTEYEAYCDVCDSIILIANKGQADLKQHLSSTKHMKNIRTAYSSKKIDNIFVAQTTKELKVSAVEANLAFHIVKHHQSYRSCDCTTKLFSKLFNDSEIALNISSARTKTEAIVNNVLAPYSLNSIIEKIENKKVPYIGVCTDGSNHGALKIFPVLIQYFDKEHGIQVRMLDLKSLNNEKSETICNLIITTLQKYNLNDK